MNEVTQLIEAAYRGDRQAAAALLPLVYDELRRLAAQKLAHERPGQTLEATALVHEAFLRMIGPESSAAAPEASFANRRHFYAAAAEAMRRILIDQARRKRRHKRGGSWQRTDLDLDLLPAPSSGDHLLALDEALKKLAEKHPQKAKLVELRFFAGLTGEQAAEVLGISPSSADRQWVYARAWLRRELALGESACS